MILISYGVSEFVHKLLNDKISDKQSIHSNFQRSFGNITMEIILDYRESLVFNIVQAILKGKHSLVLQITTRKACATLICSSAKYILYTCQLASQKVECL